MKVILKIKLCVMLSLLLFMTQASFSTVYSDDSKPSDTSTSVPDSGSIRIDEKTFADTLKNFNEKIQKDPKAEKSIRKLFGKIYFRYCLEFYVKNAKNKSIDINTTEFDQAKKFAGSNLPDKPFRSAINIQGWKVVRQWLKEDSTNSLINVENKHNISSLSFAALSGNLKIVKDLIAKGADVKSKDDLGNMPL
ncbi:MAG: hypothetical protein LBE12_01930, partial [Planctomycetaceae bacterium]|nr:hypothetical protein [Planctomycetaceae bacterium]